MYTAVFEYPDGSTYYQPYYDFYELIRLVSYLRASGIWLVSIF